METVVLVVHLLLALGLIGVVLIQKSEGGGLGIGGGGSGGMGLMSARGSANLLTRTTAILAACFMVTSVVLAILAGAHREPRSILDTLPAETPSAPAAPEPSAVPPAEPAAPRAPISE